MNPTIIYSLDTCQVTSKKMLDRDKRYRLTIVPTAGGGCLDLFLSPKAYAELVAAVRALEVPDELDRGDC